MARRLFIPS